MARKFKSKTLEKFEGVQFTFCIFYEKIEKIIFGAKIQSAIFQDKLKIDTIFGAKIQIKDFKK